MTRPRYFGEDKPICDWLRKHPELDSAKGISLTDCDLFIHRYMTVCDKCGMNGKVETREVQALLTIECKTRSGQPSDSQRDTLSKFHTFNGTQKTENYIIRNFGVAFLSMSGTRPDDSDILQWGRFLDLSDQSKIVWKRITEEMLLDLIGFKIHPDNFLPNPFRRHHAKKEIFTDELTDLGFEIPIKVFQRS